MVKPDEKTILVVDDEEDVRDYLSTVLEDAGYNVVTAVDGNDAIEKLRQKVPDFISLDLVMPGKSGIKFLYEMRHNPDWAGIPFVIVTAHAHDDLGKEDLDDILSGKTFSGPSVYLEKPVKPEQYVKFISERLGVEIESDKGSQDEAELRDQLEKMLKGADSDALKKAIRVLKTRK